MAYTLLQLVQQVCDEIGITRPNQVIGSTDQTTRQLLAFANKVGRDLVREHDWRRLVKEYVFETTAARSGTALVSSANTLTGFASASSLAATGYLVSGTGIPKWAEVTVVTETQLTLNVSCEGSASATVSCTFSRQFYDLPSDFERQLPDTQRDRSNSRQVFGHKNSQEWQWLKGGFAATRPTYRYRLYQNQIQIHPAPDERLRFVNEYVSGNWVASATGGLASRTTFSTDTEQSIFPDDVMVNGVKWHFMKAKGLEYLVVLNEFNRSVSYAKAQDTPASKLSLSPEVENFLVGTQNLPDGDFGL